MNVRINVIERGTKEYDEISKFLVTLLLSKSDYFKMLRREFFVILTTQFDDCDKAVAYLKNIMLKHQM